MPEPERGHDDDQWRWIERYREAAGDAAQDITDAIGHFGKRFYEDTILRAGWDLRREAERFLEDPIATTLKVLDSFPQTRTGRTSLAGFAAVFTILANAAKGLEFERAVLAALKAAKNKTKIPLQGARQSIPDILNEGVTEIKSGVKISNSRQLKIQAAYAESKGMTFNLVVSPETRQISEPLRRAVKARGGTIQRFDPETGLFSPFQ